MKTGFERSLTYGVLVAVVLAGTVGALFGGWPAAVVTVAGLGAGWLLRREESAGSEMYAEVSKLSSQIDALQAWQGVVDVAAANTKEEIASLKTRVGFKGVGK